MQKSDYQAAFNTSYYGIMMQGCASVQESPDPTVSICLYRGANGNKCAVGHLIPDHLYTPDLENVAISDPSEGMITVLNKLFPGHDNKFLGFLAELQTAHDKVLKNHGLVEWKCRVSRIADNYGLTVSL